MFFDRTLRLLLAVLSVCTVNSAASAASARHVSIGVAAHEGAADFTFRAAQLGGLNHATVYTTLGKKELEYRKFPREFDILLVLRIPHKGQGGNLRNIRDGAYDNDLRALAKQISADGRRITLRVLPEFNGAWYSWTIYHPGNDPADFVPTWRHVVDVLRAETDLIRFDLNYNRYSAGSGGKTADFASLYPGDEWVDQVSISSYNRCGLVADNKTPRSFADDFKLAYDTIVGIVGPQVPLAIAETSTTSLCGTRKAVWFEAVFTELEKNFTRVTNATFFFVPVKKGAATNDIPIHWELENPAEVKMFRGLIAGFRKRMGIAPPRLPAGMPVQKTDATPPGVSVIPSDSGVHMPWSIWGRIEAPVQDSYNPEPNPVTGDPFDTMGLRFRFRATQAIMWDIPDSKGLSYGLEASVAGVASTNENRWWDNSVSPGLRLQVCDSSKPSGVDWGSICAFVEGKHTTYFVPVPERLESGETYVGVGVEFKYGGDLNKK